MSQNEPAEVKGPGFSDTVVLIDIKNLHGHTVKPEIMASIQKGFFQVDNKWTCYRRNYFQVNCGFTYKPQQDHTLFLFPNGANGQHKQIYGYAVSISAKTGASGTQDGETRGLVQHTPKRQKHTETTPPKRKVVPQPIHSGHSHPHHHHAHGYGIPGTMGVVDSFYGQSSGGLHISRGMGYDNAPIPASHTFERIQFQKATANNGKRRAQQQFFHVVVELSANISPDSHREEWVMVATRESEPMVVRGRSPGHYKDTQHRRDSQSHMDPDRHGGHDRGILPFNPYATPQIGYDSAQNVQQSGYSGVNYRAYSAHHGSPPSAGSSTTLNGSPDDEVLTLSDNDTIGSAGAFVGTELTPPSDAEEDALFPLSRKRRMEEDSDDDRSYRFTPPLCDNLTTQPMDFPSFTHSKAVCASS
jgi:meiosis-specific transcription factor NDT80